MYLNQMISQVPATKHYRKRHLERVPQLLRLINDVLDLSKVEAGSLDLEFIPFELGEVLGDALKLLALRADKKGWNWPGECNPTGPRG